MKTTFVYSSRGCKIAGMAQRSCVSWRDPLAEAFEKARKGTLERLALGPSEAAKHNEDEVWLLVEKRTSGSGLRMPADIQITSGNLEDIARIMVFAWNYDYNTWLQPYHTWKKVTESEDVWDIVQRDPVSVFPNKGRIFVERGQRRIYGDSPRQLLEVKLPENTKSAGIS